MHVENEFSLAFGEIGGLVFAYLVFKSKPLFESLHVNAISGLEPAKWWLIQQIHNCNLFHPNTRGSSCYEISLSSQPLDCTYQDIWPSPLSAPWQASVFPLTSWRLEWEWGKNRLCVSNVILKLTSSPVHSAPIRSCSSYLHINMFCTVYDCSLLTLFDPTCPEAVMMYLPSKKHTYIMKCFLDRCG